MNKIVAILAGLFISTSAFANEVFMNQMGDNITLTITQNGEDNTVGNTTTNADLISDDVIFSITQDGNNNSIAAVIKGNTYVGNMDFFGSSNTLDLKCDSAGNVTCESVAVKVTSTGNLVDFKILIGQTANSQSSVVAFSITGDGHAVYASVDGVSANIEVTMDNSTTLSTATYTDIATGMSTDAGGNMLKIIQTGNGDITGHSVIMNITGGGGVYDVTQSGIYDNAIDITFVGDDQNVTITQTD